MIRQESLGGPEVLRMIEADRPEPGPTEVLVRVHAAGVNPVDWKVRRSGGFLGRPPFTVGWDVSGTVEKIGRGVTRFAVGDEVFGMPRFPAQAAAYAEYITAPSRHLARKPATLSHVEAAGLPLAGLTARQVLVDTANLQPGQRVLVPAAAGGVGHLAVQLAKALGAHVVATASPAKHEFVLGLGADEVIDYTSMDIATSVTGIDVAIGLIGPQAGAALATVRPGGLLVAMTSDTPPEVAANAAERGVRALDFLAEPDHAGLEALALLADQGRLRVHVAKTFPLQDAAAAHAYGETGRTIGKIVLVP
ncbi:NADPH:quinone reductase [Rhizocola hellebori]|uniref:NADPH:quinone reductase n=1 Tax=Rhizocola hellebori TaxID=1392758 RepID=A0A8J3QDA4_9ACTN|nr:NADP-dependent oxidoreductase [Rhizocola hellebori]GIH08639.1 NADPH:quinone reductase [Rhizocola hellebori]